MLFNTVLFKSTFSLSLFAFPNEQTILRTQLTTRDRSIARKRISETRPNMVHSRSETNLNRILVDLCTSPTVRPRHDKPRQYHPPLPTLKPIRSNSCSNIDDVVSHLTQLNTEERSAELECLDLTVPYSLPTLRSSNASIRPTAISLTPMPSTGFIVQPTSHVQTTPSFSLFETLSINHLKKSSAVTPLIPMTPKDSVLKSTPSNSSNDFKAQDYTKRLRNRLTSREYLRKKFLS